MKRVVTKREEVVLTSEMNPDHIYLIVNPSIKGIFKLSNYRGDHDAAHVFYMWVSVTCAAKHSGIKGYYTMEETATAAINHGYEVMEFEDYNAADNFIRSTLTNWKD